MNDPLLNARASWIVTTAAVVAQLEVEQGSFDGQIGQVLLRRVMTMWAKEYGMAELQAAVRDAGAFAQDMAEAIDAEPLAANDG